jgi:hypothetical protein
MPYLLVLLVAITAGVAVALLTLRAARVAAANPEAWTEPYREGETGSAQEGARTSRTLPPPAPTPHTRKVGAAGLLGAILIGAGTIALLSFFGWTMLKRIFG